MAGRQFGQVVYRALAVYLLVASINQLHQIINIFFLSDVYPGEPRTAQKYISIGISSVFLLLAAFLWTNAERLVGNFEDTQPTLRAGNWVVRLMFTSLGILICAYSIDSLIEACARMAMPRIFVREWTPDSILYVVMDLVRFLVGLGLMLAYRFDKNAVVQAAEAIQPPASA